MNFQTYLINSVLNLANLGFILIRGDVDASGPSLADPTVHSGRSSKTRPTTGEGSDSEIAGHIAGEGGYGGAG